MPAVHDPATSASLGGEGLAILLLLKAVLLEADSCKVSVRFACYIVPEKLTLDGNEAGGVLGGEALERVHGGIPVVECQ